MKLIAQISQNGIFFQAVAKDNYDNPANRRYLFIQSSIIQSSITGPKVFIEEFQTTTDQAGIFTISIGKGIKKGGTVSKLSEIDWASGPYLLNLKIVITPIAPGANWDYTKEWIDIGTTSFGTVPYALYASSSGDLGNKVNISDSIIKYVTPTQLNAKTFDITPIIFSLSNKVDKVIGQGLSSNDYTTLEKNKISIISGINTGDETTASIKTKLGITTLSGSNTGDQDVSSFATITNLALKANESDLISGLVVKANSSDVTNSLGLKANVSDLATGLALKANSLDVTTSLGLKANVTDLISSLALKVNTSDVTTSLGLKANVSDLTSGLVLKVDKVTGKELSTNDYTTTEKNKLAIITGVNTGDQDISTFATITNLALKVNTTDLIIGLGLKANSLDVTTSLGLKANVSDLTSGLVLKVDKVTGKELSTNDYTSTEKNKLAAITGTNEGDETTATIKTKLGIITLSGSNTGDQDLSSFSTITNLALKANSSDMTTSLGLKANATDLTSGLALKANTSDMTTSLGLKANSSDVTTSLGLKANETDLTSGLALKVDKVTGKELSTNDYSTAEKNKLTAITGTNTGDQDVSSFATITNLALKANSSDMTTSLGLKANATDLTSGLALKANTSDMTTSLGLKANSSDVTTSLGLKANETDLTSGLALKVDKVTGKELSTNDYTTIEKNKLTAITGTNTGDETLATIKTKLAVTILSGDNTGDENTAGIKTKLGITTLSGSNTGDQDLSSFASTLSLADKANTTDVTTSLALKANLISPTLVTPILGEATATSVTASGDLKAKRFINSLVTASPTIDLTTGNFFQINLTSNISFLLPTASASNIGTYLIKFTQDATGSRVVTFANNATTTIKLLWSGGGVPVITATPNKTDIMTIICDGVKYYATTVQNF